MPRSPRRWYSLWRSWSTRLALGWSRVVLQDLVGAGLYLTKHWPRGHRQLLRTRHFNDSRLNLLMTLISGEEFSACIECVLKVKVKIGLGPRLVIHVHYMYVQTQVWDYKRIFLCMYVLMLYLLYSGTQAFNCAYIYIYKIRIFLMSPLSAVPPTLRSCTRW